MLDEQRERYEIDEKLYDYSYRDLIDYDHLNQYHGLLDQETSGEEDNNDQQIDKFIKDNGREPGYLEDVLFENFE